LAMAGILQVIPANGTTYAPGDAFKIINGTITGTPSEIIPANPGDGLTWDLSEFNSNGKLKVILTTGLNDSHVSGKIYPNPFTDKLQISIDQPSEDVMISIVNMTGQTVYNNSIANTGHINLNLENLDKGVYLLHIKVGDNISTQKIVKE